MPTATHKVMLNDILPPLNGIVIDRGEPVELSAYTPKFRLLDSSNTAVLDDVTAGLTVQPTQAFTVDTATNQIKCKAHGVKEGDKIAVANSGGALPTGLAASTNYFACEVSPDRFKLETYPGAGGITGLTAGTGTHTFYIVGSFQMDFSLTEVDAAGEFKGFIRLYSGSEYSTFPKGQGEYIPVSVSALG